MSEADEDPYWVEVRSRSETVTPSGLKVHCAVCWISFQYGATYEGKPLPCPQHANDDEKARAARMFADPEFHKNLREEIAPLLERMPKGKN